MEFLMPVVAMDCEMVGSENGDLLARVSIVNQAGSILLDEYVKPSTAVIDHNIAFYVTTKKHMDSVKSLRPIQSKVSNLLRGKLLVGHSLQNDLNVLGVSHSKYNRRDLEKYRPFMKNGKKQSLKDLAQNNLNKTIKDGKHDSVTGARTAMELYFLTGFNWHNI